MYVLVLVLKQIRQKKMGLRNKKQALWVLNVIKSDLYTQENSRLFTEANRSPCKLHSVLGLWLLCSILYYIPRIPINNVLFINYLISSVIIIQNSQRVNINPVVCILHKIHFFPLLKKYFMPPPPLYFPPKNGEN